MYSSTNAAAAWSILFAVIAYWALGRFRVSGVESMVLALLLCLGLVLVNDRGMSSWLSRNPILSSYAEAFANPPSDSSSWGMLTRAMNRIARVPSSVKNIIMDGLDNVALSYRSSSSSSKTPSSKSPAPFGMDDNNSNNQEGEEAKEDDGFVDMSAKLYEQEGDMQGDGRYKQVMSEYALLHYLMCTFRALDKPRYTSFFRATLKRDPIDLKLKREEIALGGKPLTAAPSK